MARMVRLEELEDSATAHDEIAAYELGMCHASGSGGAEIDLVQAHRWLNVAAALGYAPAAVWRGELATEMSRREIVEAQKLARATLTRRVRLAA